MILRELLKDKTFFSECFSIGSLRKIQASGIDAKLNKPAIINGTETPIGEKIPPTTGPHRNPRAFAAANFASAGPRFSFPQ
ncbi:hypothetical protein PthBH41_15570 [Parageobacillus thermoglucosidasius]|nr:hypothetical protein PthBH41_15570 [Parageobacillus thermoglucosidasius]GGK26550.1 hypothetical protein GCM10010965_19040 [Caldalkalibacillus thermarum]